MVFGVAMTGGFEARWIETRLGLRNP